GEVARETTSGTGPDAVTADGERHDLEPIAVERGGDRARGGERDLVLARGAAAHHDHAHARVHAASSTCTRGPMRVTMSCSIVPAQRAQSCIVGSPASPWPNSTTSSPGSTPASPTSIT